MKLTVIIRNPAPFIFMQEPVSHRRVTILLTDWQIAKLELQHVGTSGKAKYHEEVAMCFLEME